MSIYKIYIVKLLMATSLLVLVMLVYKYFVVKIIVPLAS